MGTRPRTKAKSNSPIISTKKLNAIYQHNQIKDSDNTASPTILLNYVQYYCENEWKGGADARFVDPFPFRCPRDNFDSEKWRDDYPNYINPPFSAQNPKKILSSAVQWHSQCPQKRKLIYLAKTNAFGSHYWQNNVPTA